MEAFTENEMDLKIDVALHSRPMVDDMWLNLGARNEKNSVASQSDLH